MEFVIKNVQESINGLMRKISYKPAYFSRTLRDPARGGGKMIEEFSIVRQLTGNNYPRFHLYIKKVSSTVDQSTVLGYSFNLHLDQKKPSYEGSKGHSGEYDGDVVEGEAERIKNLLL